MLKYIIRLDDACPNMDKNKWERVEKILDNYKIKPIVGIIPDNKDPEFKSPLIENFWTNYAQRWQNKGWLIAQHGLHHNLSKIVRTEFSGKNYEEQYEIIQNGYNILKKHGINPECFFAPAHTFDDNTIKACKNIEGFKFISDGYAFFPYKYKEMLFFPNIFDTPHKISNRGVFTFVFHPNNMQESDFEYLENFIINNQEKFSVNIDELIQKYGNRKRNVWDKGIYVLINLYRKIKKTER